MKRKLIHQLLYWKESSLKPLLLTGGKGVGKTYLVNDFAKTFYAEAVYLNFEREPYLVDLIFDSLKGSIGEDSFYKADEIQKSLMKHFHLAESTGPILVILDEITFCPDYKKIIKALLATELFSKIIAISSILRGSLSLDLSVFFYPLHLTPLDFEEFLIAIGSEWYIEVIREHFMSNKKIPDIVHKELLSIFQLYLQVGGMPLAVNEYVNTESLRNIGELHQLLLDFYLGTASRLNTESEFLKINHIIDTFHKQLLKNNKKFQYTLIRKGATFNLYAEAISFLKDSFFGLNSYKLPEELLGDSFTSLEKKINTISNENIKNLGFKLYMPDVGLLDSFLKLRGGGEDELTKRALWENYVAQTLMAKGYPLFFWESSSLAKLDFIIIKENIPFPIEIKTGENTRSRNFSIFRTKFKHVTEAIKISARNFEYSNNTKYVPVYAVFCI